jgi:D-glycero-beta-D-manno-heptose-7-phosphate kinase
MVTEEGSLESILQRFPGRRVLVVGDVMLDEYVWGSVRRISPEAPVPVVELDRRSHAPGGAANTAANVAGLRAEVFLAGVVGGDESGRRLLETLEAHGVHREGVFVDPSRPTTTKTRVVAHGQQVVRIDQEHRCGPGAILEAQLLRFVEDRMEGVDACILSDYAKGVVSANLAQRVIRHAVGRNKPVIVDPKGADFAKYRGATLVKPNLHEAGLFLRREVTSTEDVVEVGQRLQDLLGSQGVLLTRGAEGMCLFEGDGEPLHILAQAREVYDVTGAGDTVAATLAVALAAGASLEQAARLASRAAAIIVGRVGTTAVRFDELARHD